MCQAWAFACYVRKLLGYFPKMCIKNFPQKAFKLHRKLVRRFLRYKKCFATATENLPAYAARAAECPLSSTPVGSSPATPANTSKKVVICLLSDSDVTESETDSADNEEPTASQTKETASA